jgi:hypothetical protein
MTNEPVEADVVAADASGAPHALPPWQFAGWGAARRIEDLAEVSDPTADAERAHHSSLGTLAATAIWGNDITSSCLYVSALCAARAGGLAPVVLLIVAGVLYLYRKVYAEVGARCR